MNKLAIYFSVGGVTKRMVEYMGDISRVEIKAMEPYTDADILSVNPKARCNVEQENPRLRPSFYLESFGLKDTDVNEVYLGFPLWNLKAPRIIFSYLDSYKDWLKYVPVNVFCTSGGSPITMVERELKAAYPGLKWGKFKQFSYTTTATEIKEWIK